VEISELVRQNRTLTGLMGQEARTNEGKRERTSEPMEDKGADPSQAKAGKR
jgi:hypothetical protein